jgi:hypothetical protein
MKKLIIKSNEWYDNLPEPKRTFFFLIVIMSTMLFAQYLTVCGKFIWAFPIWCTVFIVWRASPTFINWYEWYKKIKQK